MIFVLKMMNFVSKMLIVMQISRGKPWVGGGGFRQGDECSIQNDEFCMN